MTIKFCRSLTKIVAIGAIFRDGNGNSNSGQVRMYQWDGSTWVQIGQSISGEFSNDQTGFSVSLSSDGTIVAIGAPQNVNGGHVRVYKKNDFFCLLLFLII